MGENGDSNRLSNWPQVTQHLKERRNQSTGFQVLPHSNATLYGKAFCNLWGVEITIVAIITVFLKLVIFCYIQEDQTMCLTSSNPDTHNSKFPTLKNGEEIVVSYQMLLSFVKWLTAAEFFEILRLCSPDSPMYHAPVVSWVSLSHFLPFLHHLYYQSLEIFP